MSLGRQLTRCRMCDSGDLTSYLDLGHTALADGFLTDHKMEQPELTYPLNVLVCGSCGLSQLSYVVPPEILFPADYPYESSTTESGRNHFHQMASHLHSRLEPPQDGLAVDIGSNVGTLVSGFMSAGMRAIGIEPAENVANKANENGISTVHAFFGLGSVQEVVRSHGMASIVTITNVFAHIDDLASFMEALEELLLPDGVLVIEAPYFGELVANLEYDTIYHEHLSYLSVWPMDQFFRRHGYEVFDIEFDSIHGGSFRTFVARAGGHPVSGRVEETVSAERKAGLGSADSLRGFADKVTRHRVQLFDLLHGLKQAGNKIVGISAPAKGNTLLNCCNIGPDLLEYWTEKAPMKIGLFAPGTHLPVVEDARLESDQPDYGLLLAWNFAEEIMQNLDGYRQAGGRFIVPIPEPRIV
jgi:SAM-dependent methyltransferase